MQLTIINSNSTGNAYILENDREALLIECGVRIDRIKQALGYNIKKVVGCIVTHAHLDHCKAVEDVMGCGIRVWASEGTHKAMGTENSHRAMKIKRITDFNQLSIQSFTYPMFEAGSFKIRPFEVKHDCAEPLGYLINHPDCGTVLFLTDSYYCEYKFTGLNHIIIEANYCQDILDQRVVDGASPKFLRDRVFTSHMSLGTCKQTLQAYDLSGVSNIVLIHLSDGNSDAKRFKQEVEEVTGKPVHVADAGMKISLNKQPF